MRGGPFLPTRWESAARLAKGHHTVAYIDDESLQDLRRELDSFLKAQGNREFEATMLAGAVQEVLDQIPGSPASPPALPHSGCTDQRAGRHPSDARRWKTRRP